MIAEIVAQHRPRAFLIDSRSGEEFSYGEFHRLAQGMARRLQQRGVRRGSRVAFLLPNGVECAVGFFACLELGAVAVPIDPHLVPRDIARIISNSRSEWVVSAEGIAPGGGSAPEGGPEDLAVIVYTSGTTARPKGIAHRLGGLVENALAFGQVHGIGPSDRFHGVLPMAYLGGLYNLLLLPFLHGASVVIDEVFGVRSCLNFWEKPVRFGVNNLWLAPTLLAVLLKIDRQTAGEDFCRESIRRVFSGFAPLPPRVQRDFEARYGVRIFENYGLSELLFVSTTSAREPGTPGSVGKPIQGVEIRIGDEEGRPLPAGREGEIIVRSPHRMAGVLDERGQVEPMDPSGWFPTGDLGLLTPEGQLSITGRKKEIIIRGGMNVSPAAVEEVLRGFEGVADVAVISTPHELYGEDVTAVLKLQPGVELAAIRNELALYAKRELAPHQQPGRYVSMEEFPLTPTGKVRKGFLRELVINKLQPLVPA